jgi:hypothetical protein
MAGNNSVTKAADVGAIHIVKATKVAITPTTTRRTTVDHEPRTIFMEVEIIATDISVNNLKKYSEFVQILNSWTI